MTNSLFKTITARPVSNTFRIFQVLFLILAQVGGVIQGVQPALAAPLSVTIPSNFFTVVDSGGANDEVSQNDLTQMGRDDSDSSVFKLFWSWDSTDDWTGTGQTGDACALFDTDGDGKINGRGCLGRLLPDEAGLLSEVSCGLFFRVGFPS